jgi:two-component system nitrogen regulation response regulator GlnG/two-component system response regulator HydG
MAGEGSTLDEQESQAAYSPAGPTPTVTLAVMGCPDEPWRVGEVALLGASAAGDARLLGRGSAQPGDSCPRLSFARVTDGVVEVALPLGLSRLSRAQALVSRVGDDTIQVRNVGRSALIHNGQTVDVALVRPGETVQFGRQLLLLCVTRAAGIRVAESTYATGGFGHPDRYGIVGESDAAWTLRRRISFVAPRTGHVLIHGASGTGKELVAGAIHALSDRGGRPMVSRNAATLPDGILDAELFGNVRNYPNLGVPERPGLIGQAHRSTLFLDEFAELPGPVQPHLLRVLDGGDYQRLGEASARRSDFRLLAATNRPIEAIKEDLRARFGFVLELPDLNARRDDIPLLVTHLLRQFGKQDPSVATRVFPQGDVEREPNVSFALLRTLLTHSYRTNVRELEGLLWRAIETSSGGELDLAGAQDERSGANAILGPAAAESREGLSPTTPESRAVVIASNLAPPSAPAGASPHANGDLTARQLQAILDEHNGSVESAWRALGLSNRYVLRRLIAKHGIEIRRKPKPRR